MITLFLTGLVYAQTLTKSLNDIAYELHKQNRHYEQEQIDRRREAQGDAIAGYIQARKEYQKMEAEIERENAKFERQLREKDKQVDRQIDARYAEAKRVRAEQKEVFKTDPEALKQIEEIERDENKAYQEDLKLRRR